MCMINFSWAYITWLNISRYIAMAMIRKKNWDMTLFHFIMASFKPLGQSWMNAHSLDYIKNAVTQRNNKWVYDDAACFKFAHRAQIQPQTY